LQTIRFAGIWLLHPSSIIASLLILSARPKIRLSYFQQIPVYIFPFAAFGVLFLSAFIPYFSMGMLAQHRTINFALFFFLLFSVLSLLRFDLSNLFISKCYPFLQRNAFALFVVAFTLAQILGNGRQVTFDWSNRAFKQYHQAFINRENNIIKDPKAKIYPLSSIPASLQINDIKEDSTWINKCMEEYYSAMPQQKK
jgi:hypothetical protein